MRHSSLAAVAALLLSAGACARTPPAATTPSPSSVASSPSPSPQHPPPPVADAAAPAPVEIVAAVPTKPPAESTLRGGSLALAGGWTLSRRPTHLELAHADGTYNLYLEPGDAELVDDKWLVRRDVAGATYVSRWAPAPVTLAANDRRAVEMRIGDRVVLGDWAVTWTGLHEGSNLMTGKRAMHLAGSYRDRVTSAWQFDAHAPAAHDFRSAPSSAMHHLELEVLRATLAPDVRDSSLVVRVREVDRATPASFGASLPPGLYVFDGGVRLTFEKSTLCGMGKVCVCRDIHSGAIEVGGAVTPLHALNDGQAVVVAGYSIVQRAGAVQVTRVR